MKYCIEKLNSIFILSVYIFGLFLGLQVLIYWTDAVIPKLTSLTEFRPKSVRNPETSS